MKIITKMERPKSGRRKKRKKIYIYLQRRTGQDRLLLHMMFTLYYMIHQNSNAALKNFDHEIIRAG